MGAGKLKMWNADRGFGFIKDDAGGPDMFLHINELKSAGIDSPKCQPLTAASEGAPWNSGRQDPSP
jgi:hypothetical protein